MAIQNANILRIPTAASAWSDPESSPETPSQVVDSASERFWGLYNSTLPEARCESLADAAKQTSTRPHLR
jgi:hypothetical protein